MEHRYGLDETTTHPEDGNYRQMRLHPTFGRRWWSTGLSHRVGAIQRSHGRKSLAPWLVSWLEVGWGNHRRGWYFLSYTLCWGETSASMWTTSDDDHSRIFLVCAWVVVTYYQCGWMSPSRECNTSTGGKLVQQSTFIWHKWGTYRQYMIVSHYDRPQDVHVEWELCHNIV